MIAPFLLETSRVTIESTRQSRGSYVATMIVLTGPDVSELTARAEQLKQLLKRAGRYVVTGESTTVLQDGDSMLWMVHR